MPVKCPECRRCKSIKEKETNLYCHDCRNILTRLQKVRYREKNIDKLKVSRKLAYDKNKEAELFSSRRYKMANKEKLKEYDSKRYKSKPEIGRYYRSIRRAKEKQARPAFANLKEIRKIYAEATTKSTNEGIRYHVDHIVPLTSNIVCGLHWEGNLQIITMQENQRKKNFVWPDMP